ncbi:hypothetical protein AC1031_012166 [Aphanomyces cochlioides]|nr:hypothetical protein AC1031_012166 [Aphanomyces cochlioides]
MSPAASRHVVLSELLLPMICGYQKGIPIAMVPLRDACNVIKMVLEPLRNRPALRTDAPLDAIVAANGSLTVWYATHGLDHLDQLYTDMPGSHHVVLLHAALYGFVPVVQHEHKRIRGGLHTCPWYLIDVSAAGGQYHVLQYLDSIDYTGCTTAAMDHAAINNYPAIVEWLHKNRREGCSHRVLRGVVAARNPVMLRWLVHNRPEVIKGIDDAIMKAVQTQQEDVLDWLAHISRNRELTI